ncbi:MAG: hypothetical protein VX704_09135, partial [Verrucomicrobiota bacterium]|nr:hypothetical protein [Verrucomicrobiota bacterium]
GLHHRKPLRDPRVVPDRLVVDAVQGRVVPVLGLVHLDELLVVPEEVGRLEYRVLRGLFQAVFALTLPHQS